MAKAPSHPRREKIDTDADDSLSKAEIRITDKVTQGLTNKEIAADLGITEATVKMHLKNILRKRGFTNRTELAVWRVTENMKEQVGGLLPLLEERQAMLPPQEHRFTIEITLTVPAGVRLTPNIKILPERKKGTK